MREEILPISRLVKMPNLTGFTDKISLIDNSKPFSMDCQIAANHDLEAIACWLKKHSDNAHTFESYRREAKRFMMWCVYQQGRTLGQLKVQDFDDFLQFLKNPPKKWCATRAQLREGENSPNWRPFVGPLGSAAIKMSVRVLHSLLNYCVEAFYLRANPLKLMDKTKIFSKSLEDQKYQVWERMLEEDEWAAIQKILETLPDKTQKELVAKVRVQFLFSLLYFLGLRIHEVANHTWDAFRYREGQWWFFVIGKGGRKGHIPVHDKLLSFVKMYRVSLGKLPLPATDELTPFFSVKNTEKPLSIRQLYNLVKKIGQKASTLFPDNPLKANKLQKLSPHWLRHLSASHQDKAGISATMIKENLRHASTQTTQIYLHSEDELRHKEIQKMNLSLEAKPLENKSIYSSQTTLKITLTQGPLSRHLGLLHLFNVLETQILSGFTWQPVGFDKEKVLAILETEVAPIYKIKFGYCVNDLDALAFKAIEKELVLECRIRLFECELYSSTRGVENDNVIS